MMYAVPQSFIFVNKYAFSILALLPAIFLTLLTPTSSLAESSQTLVYAYEEDNLFEIEPNVEVHKFNPVKHYAKLITKKAGLKLAFKHTPVKRMFRNLETGDANFSIMVKTKKLNECCITSKDPVHTIQLGVFRHSNAEKIETIEQLVGQKLIVIHGYSYSHYETFLKESKDQIKTIKASSHRAAFELLNAGRADYMLNYNVPAVRKALPQKNNSVSFDLLHETNLYLVLNKIFPNHQETMQRLEKVAREVPIKIN